MLMRCLMAAAFALFVGAADAGEAAERAFPVAGRALRIVIPQPPGTPLDLLARAVMPLLSTDLGAPVVIDNRPGAEFVIGTLEVVRARPDGHTVLLAGSTVITLLPHTHERLPYDPLADLTPLVHVARSPLVLVSAAAAALPSFDDFRRQARAAPGRLNFGSSNAGFALTFGQIRQAAGIDVAIVPHRSPTEVLQGMGSGDIQVAILAASQAHAAASGGRVRLLAAIEDARIPLVPDVPTVAELGLAEVSLRGGVHLFGPAKLPPVIAARLVTAWRAALATPEARSTAERIGYGLVADSGPQVVAQLLAQHTHWGNAVRAMGWKAQ